MKMRKKILTWLKIFRDKDETKFRGITKKEKNEFGNYAKQMALCAAEELEIINLKIRAFSIIFSSNFFTTNQPAFRISKDLELSYHIILSFLNERKTEAMSKFFQLITFVDDSDELKQKAKYLVFSDFLRSDYNLDSLFAVHDITNPDIYSYINGDSTAGENLKNFLIKTIHEFKNIMESEKFPLTTAVLTIFKMVATDKFVIDFVTDNNIKIQMSFYYRKNNKIECQLTAIDTENRDNTFEINRNIILTRKDLVNENNEKTFDDFLTQFGIRDRFFIETSEILIRHS